MKIRLVHIAELGYLFFAGVSLFLLYEATSTEDKWTRNGAIIAVAVYASLFLIAFSVDIISRKIRKNAAKSGAFKEKQVTLSQVMNTLIVVFLPSLLIMGLCMPKWKRVPYWGLGLLFAIIFAQAVIDLATQRRKAKDG